MPPRPGGRAKLPRMRLAKRPRTFGLSCFGACLMSPASAPDRLVRSLTLVTFVLSASGLQAQVPFATYADDKDMIDVQRFTCAQLATTYQEDADALAMWYSGWYNVQLRPRHGRRFSALCLLRG